MILFNLPENYRPNFTLIKFDIDHLNFISNKFQSDIRSIKTVRLGKPSSRHRPLKISLADSKNTFENLRAQFKLRAIPKHQELRFSSGRTPSQREYRSNI